MTPAFLAITLVALTAAALPALAAEGTPASAGAASAPPPLYRSALADYRRYDEAALLPWRDSIELVGRIGGWRSYARESQGGERAAPIHSHGGHGNQDGQGKPGGPGRHDSGHGGHGGASR